VAVDLSIEIRNQESLQAVLRKLSGPAAKEAYAKALNDTGFKARRDMSAAMRSSFDRVTPYIERSPKVVPATADKLSVAIIPTLDARNKPSKGGKQGVDPQYVLQAQEFGGRRADKKSEKRLRQAGLLPDGYQTAIPQTPFPGSDDGRGNLRGTFMQQLLSYFATYSEAGYRANMSKRRRTRMEDRTSMSLLSNKRQVKLIRGVVYFVSWGALRSNRHGNTNHLAPGIWAKSGTHGAVLQPVLMFVRAPSYRPRLGMDRIAKQSGLQEYLDRRVRFRIREAAGI
jgi:hypothetical protein